MSTQPQAHSIYPKKLNPAEAVGPAWSWMMKILFRPFRWERWVRIALAALTLTQWNIFSINLKDFASFMEQSPTQDLDLPVMHFDTALVASIITVLVVGMIVLLFVHYYVGSVLRFVLFDGVCNGRFELQAGWKRWHDHGLRYYGFQAGLLLFSLIVYGSLGGLATFFALKSGLLTGSRVDWAKIVALLGPVTGLLFPLSIMVSIVINLCSSFVVPVMATDGQPLFKALGTVARIVSKEVLSFLGYLLMQFLLTIMAGIAVVIILIPVVIVGVIVLAIVFAATSSLPGHGYWLAGISILLSAAMLLVFVMFTPAPVAIFFQCYALQYFSGRFKPLWDLMHPEVKAASVPQAARLDMTPGDAPAM